MVTSTQEMQWVLRAQCHDREALEALLRSVQPSLRRYLSGLAGATDADDLLQDVLVLVVCKLGMLEEPEVAAILDIPLGTAKSRLGYGLSSIRKHLKALEG
jgi:DNA-directed RNA polymerase specialized sigma24 family protein